MTRLESFGWRGAVEPGIGRIVSAHGDYYHLVCNEAGGEIIARKKKSNFKKRIQKVQEAQGVQRVQRGEIVGGRWQGTNSQQLTANNQYPITGDFVRFRYNAQGESMITEILPRFSHFERKDPTARRQSQTLAVNFDTLFVMMSLNENFSTARIERFLALAEDMGEAKPVVVLTKCDLLGEGGLEKIDPLGFLKKLNSPPVMISSLTGEGIDAVRKFVTPGRTVAFIGSSGVGKSTLLNVLAGEEWAATQEIQEWSGKGRHTTTSRELVMLPNGAMVVDTPGIREIGMLGETEATLAKGESSHRYRLH